MEGVESLHGEFPTYVVNTRTPDGRSPNLPPLGSPNPWRRFAETPLVQRFLLLIYILKFIVASILILIKMWGFRTESTVMRRRKLDTKTKAMIVIEGLKGKPVAALCAEHQISQTPYDQWRDQFLAHAPKAFEVYELSPREAPLARGNARLKTLVRELTVELKTSSEFTRH
jgi:hypothetical protein